jgi:4-amino-4-deoxy-L-arabinose transferase-like glycosyltransferase
MSQTVDQSSEPLFEQASEPQDFDSQVTGLRQQITSLQRELTDLDGRLRDLERQRQQTPIEPSTPPMHASARSEPMRVRVQEHWMVLIAVVLSLVLVYGGQFLLRSTDYDAPDEGLKQALAGGMLIAGALVFGAYLPPVSHALARLDFAIGHVKPVSFVWRNRWTVGWLSAAVGLAILAIILFATRGENVILVLMWLVSIGALVISQRQGTRRTRSQIKPEERMYLAALGLLLLIALVTRVYKLTTLPYDFDGDFASVGLQARALLTGEQKHIFAYGWADIPMLGYLPAMLGLRLFGNNLAGLNASGVMEGLLIIVGVYLIGRDLFHVRVGLIAAALLTISYAHLAASRQCSYLDPVVFLVFALYLLFVGLHEGRGGTIVASGILTAFCALVYYPSRIIILIAGFMLLYLLLFRRKWLFARGWTIFLWILAVLITLGPMLVVFLRDVNGFMSRTHEVFILSPEMLEHTMQGFQVDTIPEVLWEQARRSLLLFHYYHDTGTQFDFPHPLLDPFTAPLFTLGMGYALFQWRRFGPILLFVWIVFVVFVGSFLTGNPPFWVRLLLLLPPAALLAALALNAIYEFIHPKMEPMDSWARSIAPAALLFCLLAVGVVNWNTYVEAKGTYATARARIARYLADQPDATTAYLVSNDFDYRDREFEFLAPGRLVASLTPEQMETEIQPGDMPTLLIVSAEQAPQVQRLQQLFPNGTAERHAGNSPDEVAFYVFRLPE